MPKLSHVEDIWNCKLAIRRFRKMSGAYRRRTTKMPEYPATLGDFTLGEIKRILMTIYDQPLRDQHLFTIRGQKYIVDVYKAGSAASED